MASRKMETMNTDHFSRRKLAVEGKRAGGHSEWLQLERSRYCLGRWEAVHKDGLRGTELSSHGQFSPCTHTASLGRKYSCLHLAHEETVAQRG